MSLRAILRSVSCWRASGDINICCIGAKATNSSVKLQRCSNVRSNVHLASNVCCSISKKMLSTFEEYLFKTKQQQSTRLYSVNNGNRYHGMQHKTEQDIQLEYDEAIKTLNTLQSNADTIRRSIAGGVKQTCLKDMLKFLERSGITLEELDKQSCIHVSGTKGKGSTCALTESILREYGVKTGFFSSPHLISVTERIRLNGESIDKQKFTRAFWHIYNRLKAAQNDANDMPAYFKFLTLLAFHIFIAEKVDVIILEVGIGGELDCTNVLRNTKIVGITSLGLEHTQLLGETLREIAWQKAGIIKTGSHVYTSVTQPECLEVIKERAAEKNATLHIAPAFSTYCQDPNYKSVLMNLNNVTQLNGSLAIQLAYDWLRQHKNGFKGEFDNHETNLTKAAVNGLINCNWPGRCQRISVMNFNIHLDGAHTVESMHVCSDWFEQITKESTAPKVLIFNTTGDRDSKKLLDILRQHSVFDLVCFVPNIVARDGSNLNDIQSSTGFKEQLKRVKMNAESWNQLRCKDDTENNSHVFESILESFNFIGKFYGSERQLDVLVTGSLHLIGATILALNKYKKHSNIKNIS